MSGYLLDTHSLLWSIWQPEQLGSVAISIIENRSNDVYVSSISLWEISLKYSLGKLVLGCKPDEVPALIDQMGFMRAALSVEEAASFYQLPRVAHKDPFDRMLIWQALSNQLILISKDCQFADYKQAGLQVSW